MNTINTIIQDDLSLDAKIVARMAGLNYQTVLRHIRNGNLKATRSASYMIKPEDVREFISNLPELSRVGPRRAAKRLQAKV
jgi:Helix-turn-helix domain